MALLTNFRRRAHAALYFVRARSTITPQVHRKFTVSGDAASLRELARKLEPLEGIITLAFSHDASLKPPGALLAIQSLNNSADEVLRQVQRVAGDERRVVICIDSSSSIIDVRQQQSIDNDADEMLWEEMEQNLRNQGRLSPNSLMLMALGGIAAAAGIASPSVIQIGAFVTASIVAPGFDSIAGISLGLVLRRWHVVGRAALAALVGYAVVMASGALTFALLRALQVSQAQTVQNEGAIQILLLGPAPLAISAASAAAGALMIVSLRDIYVIGPLIGLVLIPAAAMIGCAAVGGEWSEATRALLRVAADAALVLGAAAAVFWVKQRTVHRRRPLD